MYIQKLFVLSLLILAACSTAPAVHSVGHSALVDCQKFDGANYCVTFDPASTNQDEIVALHGFMDDEHMFQKSYFKDAVKQAKEFIGLYGNNPPKIITISYGRSWMLTPLSRYSSPQKATVPHILSVLAEIEHRYPLRGRRMGFGISMGGFNLTQVALRNPGLFEKIALVNPFFNKCDPFKIWTINNGCVKCTIELIVNARNVIIANFPTPELWAEVDPLPLLVKSSGLPKMIVTDGTNDGFLFYYKAQEFAATSGATWIPTSFDHVHWPVKDIWEFLK